MVKKLKAKHILIIMCLALVITLGLMLNFMLNFPIQSEASSINSTIEDDNSSKENSGTLPASQSSNSIEPHEVAPVEEVSPPSASSPAPAPPVVSSPRPLIPQPLAPPTCPSGITGVFTSAPMISKSDGLITGTTSQDMQDFATKYNALRIGSCLHAVPLSNIRYSACLEERLIWMAEDPSEDPLSAWGHIGSVRSDGLPSHGCDGNLAGGPGDNGSTVAQKWWDSADHRSSLYKPTVTGGVSDVCVYFALTRGGVPNESQDFVRAAATWGAC